MKWEELTTDKLEDQRINKISIFFIVSKDQEELGVEGVDGILNVDMGDIIRIKGQEPLANQMRVSTILTNQSRVFTWLRSYWPV